MSTLVNTKFPEVFVIRSNGCDDAGFGHKNSIQRLTHIKTKRLITKIYPSKSYTIYTDNEFNNILVAGHNAHGQLGINTNSKSITTLTPLTFFNDDN